MSAIMQQPMMRAVATMGRVLGATVLDETKDEPKRTWPRTVIVDGEGVGRVLYYEQNGVFRILLADDRKVSRHRSQFRFVKGK